MAENFDILKDVGALEGTDVIAVQRGKYKGKSDVTAVNASALAAVLAAGGSFAGPTYLSNFILTVQELTESGAMSKSMLQLNHATVKIEATLTQILAGHLLVITQTDAGTAAHTLTLAGGTFDGTNNTATFNAAGETLIVLGIADGTGVIVLNSGAVAMSSV